MPAPAKFIAPVEPSTSGPQKSPKKKFKQHPIPQPSVSKETRERLYQEALAYRGCEGMAQEDVRRWVDERLEAYLSKQPFWFGHTQKADVPHRAAHAQFRREREADKAKDKETACLLQAAAVQGKCVCPWCTGKLPRSKAQQQPSEAAASAEVFYQVDGLPCPTSPEGSI